VSFNDESLIYGAELDCYTVRPMEANHVRLLITRTCPHCASVLQSLCELIKAGDFARLEVINITQTPEIAERFGVRTVPFIQVGPIELEGLQSKADLKFWIDHIGSEQGIIRYIRESLQHGGLEKVIKLLRQDSGYFSAIFHLLRDIELELPVRIGIGAIMEEYEGSQPLEEQIDNLAGLLHHPDFRVRLDVCHYLTLTHSSRAIPLINTLLNDDNKEVRDEAIESLTQLTKK